MHDLSGRVVLVTGGAVGIGRGIALALAAWGADAAILDLDADAAGETVAAIEARGRRAVHVAADVADRADFASAHEAAVAALGPIDILVNNAGILRIAALLEMEAGEWRRQFAVNVDGVLHGAQIVGPSMLDRGKGAIVNLASWIGKSAMRDYGGYAATKAAVISLTRSLAAELGPGGVRVNAICPGTIVETRMREAAEQDNARRAIAPAEERCATLPLGRPGLPDDIARVAAFLASDDSAYMTGQAINVTGGLWMT